MKTRLLITAALIGIGACDGDAPSSMAEPVAFVQLFEWQWPDVARECEQHLGPAGYSAVQVSPPNEHIEGPAWWTRYQPVSYLIESRGGTREEFADMVARCKAAGVGVYADAVINHMAGMPGGTGVAGSPFREYEYVVPYGYDDFHHCGYNDADTIVDYRDLEQVQTCQLGTLDDLDTGKPGVQRKIAAYLGDLLDLGVAGFRIDAAKHMHHDELHAILQQTRGEPFVYLEVIDRGGEPIDAANYLRDGFVTEFKYADVMLAAFEHGELDALTDFWTAPGWLPADEAIVFVDNHDIQRGHATGSGVVNYKDGVRHELAVAFMLAHPYGYPLVMSSYAFDTDQDGPPPVSPHAATGCGTNWVCEHRRSSTNAMLRFRAATRGEPLIRWQLDAQTIAFGRGDKGHVFINTGQDAVRIEAPTDLPPGTYADIVNGFTVTVGTDFKATLRLPALTVAAVLAKD